MDDYRGKPVAWVLNAVMAKLVNDERRGGDYAIWAGSDRTVLSEHPAPESTGQPCPNCGEPWPCGPVRGILAHH